MQIQLPSKCGNFWYIDVPPWSCEGVRWKYGKPSLVAQVAPSPQGMGPPWLHHGLPRNLKSWQIEYPG